MPRSGSQVILCDLPIRFDSYKGCSHACAYCFTRRKADIGRVTVDESADSVRRFIEGHRTTETNWCDWAIPLHWGGLSDPFQPVEASLRNSLACLKVLAETNYPFVVSTKGSLVAEQPYLDLLAQCSAVVQVSLVSPQYDRHEPGAPPFADRLRVLRRLAGVVRRVVVRIQPYCLGLCDDVLSHLAAYADAGVHGVTVEGMKRSRKAAGMVKVGGDHCYPVEPLRRDFERIRAHCRDLGLAFYCAENRLRSMGDDPCCCGVAGLEGFRPTTANLNHIDPETGEIRYTEQMRKPATAMCFKAMAQDTLASRSLARMPYAEAMDLALRSRTCREMMGL